MHRKKFTKMSPSAVVTCLCSSLSRRPALYAAIILTIVFLLFLAAYSESIHSTIKDEWTVMMMPADEVNSRVRGPKTSGGGDGDTNIINGGDYVKDYTSKDDTVTLQSSTTNSSVLWSNAAVLKILVLTYKRAESLQRLLDSLKAATYDGLPVSVEINIDRSADGTVNEETLAVANAFHFPHGDLEVMVQPRHAGVLGQWLGSWKVPADNTSEIAFFVEDDITVSPYFARYLRMVHERYDPFPAINGYALQAESIKHATGAVGRLEGPRGESVFLYPVLGSWGFSPNTFWWRHFLNWYNKVSREPKYIPFVSGLQPSEWYRILRHHGRAESMWTMWHIAHAYEHHLYTLYANWPGGKGGVYNWKEAGEHYKQGVMGKGQKEKVLQTWPEDDFDFPDELVIVDANGLVTDKWMTLDGIQ